ncbi:DNA-3-methyladenine glycosylase [Compostimonas suwonensis]|uniref:Putative 3-methyladenine DNA glycosylase n=1 Tax=Compostimonas suwonensis TaxID=1048394 RepID=A0A2M9BTP0_9MICO|nr:DNA-3-methyladenine glycosylase [Compostimonas suwonensis]PJJ61303.1 DNA-3-methyladenine glycosylase [Compostimonas suwonensis]
MFDEPAVVVAPRLLGAVLTHESDEGPVSVRITEVEAYLGVGIDPGSHSFRGRTPRNSVMFGEPGHLYTYFTYGMHTCANIVCSPEGESSALLLRAGEIVGGADVARRRRGEQVPARDLARGPARLTVALGIRLSQNGAALFEPPFSVTPASVPAPFLSGPRVGVSGDGGSDAFPWRFWIADDPTVSAYRKSVPRRRKPGPTVS